NGQQGTARQSREAKAKEGEAQTRAADLVLRGGNEGHRRTEELSAIDAASTQRLQLVAPWRARFQRASQGRIWARAVRAGLLPRSVHFQRFCAAGQCSS